VPAPTGNPINRARTDLGRALFFDPRLSGSGAIACATCHQPALGWQDGRPRAVGHLGAKLSRRTPTILNIAWSEPLFWDGRADTLEEQAKGPLSAPQEMNMPAGQAVANVRSIAGYRRAFAAAYPGEPITIETIARAIATFERTIVSGIAPFDRWIAGDRDAISPAARRGFALFNSPRTNCSSCHSGWRLTDDGFHDIGLPGTDPGRSKFMPDIPILEHAFKTPTLRNIAERGPYMHDGSLPTLEAVLDHYANGFARRPSLAPEMKPFALSSGEKADLIAFLQSLSSRDPWVTAPRPYR
jgi:cytochrome c peroxidase